MLAAYCRDSNTSLGQTQTTIKSPGSFVASVRDKPRLALLCIFKIMYSMTKDSAKLRNMPLFKETINKCGITFQQFQALDLSGITISQNFSGKDRDELFDFITAVVKEDGMPIPLVRILKIFQSLLALDDFILLNVALPALLNSFGIKQEQKSASNTPNAVAEENLKQAEKGLNEFFEQNKHLEITGRDCKRKYYDACRKLHPDKQKGSDEDFKKLNNLYEKYEECLEKCPATPQQVNNLEEVEREKIDDNFRRCLREQIKQTEIRLGIDQSNRVAALYRLYNCDFFSKYMI